MESEGSIRVLIDNTLKKRPATVAQLARLVREVNPVDEVQFVEVVRDMVRNKSLLLDEPSYEIETSLDYLFTITLSGWLWMALGGVALSLFVVMLSSDTFPWVIPRWIIGSVFVLYLPGYGLLQLLFPKGSDLDSLERFALNIGLSLAVVPLIGLLLNFTPWGIRLVPIAVSLGIFTILALVGAAIRKYWLFRS